MRTAAQQQPAEALPVTISAEPPPVLSRCSSICATAPPSCAATGRRDLVPQRLQQRQHAVLRLWRDPPRAAQGWGGGLQAQALLQPEQQVCRLVNAVDPAREHTQVHSRKRTHTLTRAHTLTHKKTCASACPRSPEARHLVLLQHHWRWRQRRHAHLHLQGVHFGPSAPPTLGRDI